MSNKKGSNETKQENRLGPEMQAVLNTITPRANEILNRPAWSPQMQASADAFRNYLQSAQFTQPNQNMVNMGQNLMGRGVAGNPFANMGGGMGRGMKNAGVSPATRMQNFAGFGTPETLRADNYANMTAPAMMGAIAQPKPALDPVQSIAPQMPQFTQDDFNRMYAQRMADVEFNGGRG